METKIKIIENFIKTRSFGKVQNTLLAHLEKVELIKNIDIEQLNTLYEDYLKSFIATEDMRQFLLTEFKNAEL